MLLQLLIAGLGMGCIYGLVAIGYSMVYRATFILNFALGEFLACGGLLGYTLLRLGLSFPLAFVVSVAAVTLLGAGLERGVFRPLRRRGSPLMNMIIATIGLSIALQNAELLIWGADPLSYPGVASALLHLGSVKISAGYLYTFALAIAMLVGLQLFFTRTALGIAVRAAAQDTYAARLVGVDTDWTLTLTFAVSAGFCAAAGVLISPLFYASYDMGSIGFKAFAAAVLGGLGSVGGGMVGGLLLGLVEALVTQASSNYRDAIVFSLLILVLLLAPRGLVKAGDANA